MIFLTDEMEFPPVSKADEDGLLAIGMDFTVERILNAYQNGIFPWYKDDFGLYYWYSPNPRCVLFPDKLKVSKSMGQILRNGKFRFTMNHSFEKVIKGCMTISRKADNGSWICNEFVDAYTSIHKRGFAICGECWLDGKLVGGCYGIWLNGVFFGESMFSQVSNASKFAFMNLVGELKNKGLRLIDCQQETSHMLSLGAETISRDEFILLIENKV